MLRIANCFAATLAVVVLIAGCDSGGKNSKFKSAKQLEGSGSHAAHDDHGHAHGHAEKGPNGGLLIEIGEDEYHAEVVLNEAKHSFAVYLLGSDGKTPVPTKAAELTVTPEGGKPFVLKAVPLDGEGDGASSRFELVDEKLVHALGEEGFLHGEMKVSLGEKEYTVHLDAHFELEEHAEPAPAAKADPAPAAPSEEGAAKADPAPATEPAPAAEPTPATEAAK